MNYLKIYCQLIRKAKIRNLKTGYIEKHHIFPKSIFKNSTEVVNLTYREHFIAHLLLAKICNKRYGQNHIKTRKMNMAIHRMIYTTKSIKQNSRKYDIARKAVKLAKIGKSRPDCYGKKYFGASEEKIISGIEKMRLKKKGKKYPYRPRPELRKPCTEERKKNISISRQKTLDKFLDMDEIEFWNWIYSHSKYRKLINSNRLNIPNPNITAALTKKGIPLCKYYDITDFDKFWLNEPGNKEKFYGS